MGFSLSAKDLGIILDASADYESAEALDNPGMEKAHFSGIIRPWFSTPLGERSKLYLSAGALLKYEGEGKEYTVVPELYHTEFTFRPQAERSLGIGRMFYTDPLGFIADGLFDGIAWESPAGAGRISLGAYYTGLLYKKTAYITITEDELVSYYAELDHSNFWDTYCAPKRVLAALNYTSLLGESARLTVALLGNFDLNRNESYYHSEYPLIRLSVPFKDDFVFEAGGAVELIETTGQRIQFGLAGLLQLSWMLPSALPDRLSLGWRYASGRHNNSLVEFRPFTTEPQGEVLRAKISGLTIIEADYTVRLHKSFALDLTASYFIRNDLSTYPGEEDAYLLGAEGFGRIIWSPLSDMNFELGAGAFLPQWGNVNTSAKTQWLVSLNLIMALL
jgi:hypothetical protein